MKLLIFVAVLVPAFIAVRASVEMENVVAGLASIFQIKKEDVEKCIHKMSATSEDFRLLVASIGRHELSEAEDANKLDETSDRTSIERATCVVSCCAQAQGSMIGSQMQMSVLYDMIKKSSIPREVKLLVSVVVTECNEEVKEITDECDVAFKFLRCLAAKLRQFSYR